ncbi:MAG: hypothetical protein H7A36_03190 [Chlamydiales bacterium]|nr:hypothetical protein [Chlamydiales bacterium]
MGKYVWRGLLLIALTVCALYPRPIFLKMMEWESRVVLHKRLGATFTYDSLLWENGHLVFQNGVMRKEGEFEVSFSEASWSPKISFFRRELGGQLAVEGLKIAKKSARALPLSKSRKRRLLHYNFDISMLGTHLQFGDLDLFLDIVREDEQLTFKSDLLGQNLSDLYAAFCTLFRGRVPLPLVDWDVVGGELKGELAVSFAEGHLDKLKGRVDATKIEAVNPVLELCGEWEKLHADFDLDMSSSLQVDTWNGTFGLIGGRLALQYSDFWQGMWDFSDLHSMISVKEGRVESSFLRGRFMGMEGEVDLDWHSRETLMELAFQGNSKEMLPLIPEKFQQGFAEGFPNDHFALDATVKRANQGLKLEGNLQVAKEHTLSFGCHFGGTEEMVEVMPELTPLPMDTFVGNLCEQFCLSGKRLGWFQAEGFPFERFLSPFLPLEEDVTLTGMGNFEGTFDERYLVIFYEGENVHLEGRSFDLKVARISEEVASNMVAVHYIDLKTGDHVGVLPLRHAQYTHKKQGVVFEPVQGMVHIENNKVQIKELATSWSGLEMHGEAEIFLDTLDVHIKIPQCAGPLEDAIELTDHFVSIDKWLSPVEGEFSSDNRGLKFDYVDGKKAVVFGGRCRANTTFHSVDFEENDFCFDYAQGAVTFSNWSGRAIARGKEYAFALPKLSFSPNLWEMKLAVGGLTEFRAKIEKGILSIEGENILAKGKFANGHLELPFFRVGEWQGALDLQGSVLKHFSCENGENKLFVHGKFGGEKKFEGEIEHIAFDLSTIKKLEEWHASGTIVGSGTLVYDTELHSEAIASFYHLAFGGLHFGEGESLLCHFSPTSGMTIEGLEAEVASSSYKLGSFHYDFQQEKLHFDGFDFAIPAEKLEDVAAIASDLFPGKIHTSIIDHLIALKKNEELAGRLSIELFPSTVWIALSLNDGSYYLFDQKFDLRDFSLIYDPLELNMKARARYGEDYYWLHFDTDSSTLDQGSLSVSEGKGEALLFQWEKGWKLANVSGTLRGCGAELIASNSESRLNLSGHVLFEADHLVPLLSGKMQAMLDRIDLSGVYMLEGEWGFSKEDLFNPNFVGSIKGKSCGICSVICNQLNADLTYSDECLQLKDLRVIDWSGTLNAPSLSLQKEGRGWQVSCERLALENFRLSRLTSPWTDMHKRSRPLFRSFCIPQLVLQNFSGVLGDRTSFTGQGSLHFTNYAKRTLFSNLMQLPIEITARLGLDLTTLIPVRGQVLYTIVGEKVFLDELRDVYSDGKRARFYLAEESPAYIDMNGNLDLKIKMKQYTLLMKLAEFFTLSVKGTISSPLYVLTNQGDS